MTTGRRRRRPKEQQRKQKKINELKKEFDNGIRKNPGNHN